MKTVLFVCVHNSGRSQMAEAFFNQLAKGQAQAISAGTQPAASVNPVAVEAMRQVGLDISHNNPKALTIEMLHQADRAITMGCGASDACPAGFVPSEDWALPDPQGKSLAEVVRIRDEIKRRVVRLIEEFGE